MSVRRALMLGGTAAAAMLWTTPAGALPAPTPVPAVRLPSRPSLGVAPVEHALTDVGVPPAPSALPSPVVSVADAADPVPNVVPSPPTLLSVSRPALPRDPRPGTSPRAVHPGPGSHARGLGTTGVPPAGVEHERGHVAPAVNGAVVDARPMGVSGAIDARSDAKPWSALGTAATSLALWGVLCALALIARWIVISAWRDATRRRRAFSLR